MPNPEARKIIERAMRDRAVYDKMAQREAEVWGRILPNRERNAAAAQDQEAARVLRHRDHISLSGWAHDNKRRFQRCLSLGCGEGRFERLLMTSGLCRSTHGVDVAPSAIEEARAKALTGKIDATYEVADLNFFTAEKQGFDLVVAQTSLHHLLHLEHVINQVWQALKPGGIFWVHDYIGESQFQYTNERIAVVNGIAALLPEKYRRNRISGHPIPPVVRKAPGTLVSPFESIRSQEIPGLLLKWFDVVVKRELTTILHLIAPPGTRSAFAESEDGRALFELLYFIDNFCLKNSVLSPVGGLYVLTPKANPHPRKMWAAIWRSARDKFIRR
jgi:2-polyprenyl-3-methyl-5-hydroxy-6-metoxy-1,4-benzoquinol methylase